MKDNARNSHLTTGQIGEEIAKKYLEENGYSIIEKNFKTKYAEVDLAGIKNNELIVFEVRTKRGEVFGSPEETLNNKKLKKIRLGTKIIAAAKKWQGPVRADAVCIVIGDDNNAKRINHYENII